MKSTHNNSDLLTIQEAANFLNLKVSRMYYLRFYNKIPYYKIGASIRFSKTDLNNWVVSQKAVIK